MYFSLLENSCFVISTIFKSCWIFFDFIQTETKFACNLDYSIQISFDWYNCRKNINIVQSTNLKSL